MNGKWLNLLLILLITLTIFLRFYKIGEIPNGLTWDEVAIGYNGYSVWHTHRDEWLNFMPLSFRSFGDYKAPAAIYLTGISTTLLGMSPASVRLPFALASVLALIGIFGLVKTVLKRFAVSATTFVSPTTWALIATLLLACSPWHLLFSRVGFESGMALTCIIWATWSLLLALSNRQKSQSWVNISLVCVSASLFSLSPYIYHSAKVFTPLFVGCLLIMLFRHKLIRYKNTAIFLLVFGVGLVPLLYDIAFGHALERGGVSVFSQASSATSALHALLIGFFAHFQPRFLLLGATDNLRHSTGMYGVLSPFHVVLILMAIICILVAFFRKQKPADGTLLLFSLMWIVIGILPAAISVEVPHPNRALLALPGFILLALWALLQISQGIAQTFSTRTASRLLNILLSILIFNEVASVMFFSWIYFGQYQLKVSEAFLSGYLEVSRLAFDYSTGTQHPEVDQVIFTSTYGQPYIFVLFANQLSSIAYHNGVLVKFLFPDRVSIGDLERKNTLVVAGQADKLDAQPELTIFDKNNQPRFYVYLSHGTTE